MCVGDIDDTSFDAPKTGRASDDSSKRELPSAILTKITVDIVRRNSGRRLADLGPNNRKASELMYKSVVKFVASACSQTTHALSDIL